MARQEPWHYEPMIPERISNRKGLELRACRLVGLACLVSLLLLQVGCGRRTTEEPDLDPTRVAPPALATVAPGAAVDPLTFVAPTESQSAPIAAPSALPASPLSQPAAQPTPDTSAPIPGAVESIGTARRMFRNGDYDAAQSTLTRLLLETTLVPDEAAAVHYLLARSALANDDPSHALVALGTLRTLLESDADLGSVDGAALLLLRAQAQEQLGNWEPALSDYAAAIAASPSLTRAIEPRIAALYYRLGDGDAAATAYRRAADALGGSDLERLALVTMLESLAVAYEGLGEYLQAAAVYEEILDVAQNAPYRTEILFKAGSAYAAGGDEASAIERWHAATVESPESAAAYLALVELVNREAPVDAYLRGYIDVQAGAWLPAVAAFESYLAQEDISDQERGAALLGIGQATVGLGDPAAARPYFNRIISEFAQCDCIGQAWLELANTHVLSGDPVAARRTYRTFAREYPDDSLAPEALWLSGQSALAEGNRVEAGLDLLALADAFPASERAPQSLYLIGIGALESGLATQAATVLERLAADYPDHNHDAVLYWLGRAHHAQGEHDAGDVQWQQLAALAPDSYFGVLASLGVREIALVDGAVLKETHEIVGPAGRLENDDGSRAFAEAWLAEWIDPSDAPLGDLSAELLDHPDWLSGQQLLAADLRAEALAAFNQLLQRYRDNPRVLYALSMEFERLGVASLSIGSMARLLHLAPVDLLEEAPIFLQRHAYPVPFADLIIEAAAANEISPALFFSLLRQESLFEPGARSSAAAQGLAQIIPDTGQWVADRIGHDDYVNSLLYRPYVNVRFGAYYLDWVRDYLDGNLVSALVGYNAGPGNAEQWRARFGSDDVLFVERLPFTEPRIYVQAIVANLYHYERLYPDGFDGR